MRLFHKKKELLKKIVAKKNFLIFRIFFLRLCSRVTTAIFYVNMPQNILHNIYFYWIFWRGGGNNVKKKKNRACNTAHRYGEPWKKKFKIVQQTPGELWKLLFGYANCRRLWRKYYLWCIQFHQLHQLQCYLHFQQSSQPWKNEIELGSKVCDREQFTIRVRSVACAIFIFFFTLFPLPLQKIQKKYMLWRIF